MKGSSSKVIAPRSKLRAEMSLSHSPRGAPGGACSLLLPSLASHQTSQKWGMQGGKELTSQNCLQPNECVAWPWTASELGCVSQSQVCISPASSCCNGSPFLLLSLSCFLQDRLLPEGLTIPKLPMTMILIALFMCIGL